VADISITPCNTRAHGQDAYVPKTESIVSPPPRPGRAPAARHSGLPPVSVGRHRRVSLARAGRFSQGDRHGSAKAPSILPPPA